jgi:hypothetical protein
VGWSGCYGMGRALKVLCSEGRGVSWWERVNNGACYEIMIAICKIWHKTKVLNCL